MTQSHQALPSLEEVAYNALRTGRLFAEHWEDVAPDPGGDRLQNEVQDILAVLQSGTPLDVHERSGVQLLGAVIASAADERRPGYGDRLLTQCTMYDQLFDERLDEIRLLGQAWHGLVNTLDRRDDRVTAERQAQELLRHAARK